MIDPLLALIGLLTLTLAAGAELRSHWVVWLWFSTGAVNPNPVPLQRIRVHGVLLYVDVLYSKSSEKSLTLTHRWLKQDAVSRFCLSCCHTGSDNSCNQPMDCRFPLPTLVSPQYALQPKRRVPKEKISYLETFSIFYDCKPFQPKSTGLLM